MEKTLRKFYFRIFELEVKMQELIQLKKQPIPAMECKSCQANSYINCDLNIRLLGEQLVFLNEMIESITEDNF